MDLRRRGPSFPRKENINPNVGRNASGLEETHQTPTTRRVRDPFAFSDFGATPTPRKQRAVTKAPIKSFNKTPNKSLLQIERGHVQNEVDNETEIVQVFNLDADFDEIDKYELVVERENEDAKRLKEKHKTVFEITAILAQKEKMRQKNRTRAAIERMQHLQTPTSLKRENPFKDGPSSTMKKPRKDLAIDNNRVREHLKEFKQKSGTNPDAKVLDEIRKVFYLDK